MKPICLLRVIIFSAACGFVSSSAFGQGVLDKTDLGKSQNTSADLVNSLVPGPQKYGKGEKKEEVDPKKLSSKTVKDPTFSGTLMDVDLDWTGDKLGKPRTTSEQDSKARKSVDAIAEKETKATKQNDEPGKKNKSEANSTNGGDSQNKDQKTSSGVIAAKPAEKEKTSKPDGN